MRYAKATPGRIEYHCAAFLTRSGEVILIGQYVDKGDNITPSSDLIPFLNSNDAASLAENIMRGKRSTFRVFPFPGIITTERITYPEDLVEMARSGQLVNAVVIENVPDSIEELERFAGNILRQSSI